MRSNRIGGANKNRRVSTRRFLLGSAPVGRSTPFDYGVSGRSEFGLRKILRCAPNLRRISAAPPCGAPVWGGGVCIFLSTKHISAQNLRISEGFVLFYNIFKMCGGVRIHYLSGIDTIDRLQAYPGQNPVVV